MDYTLKEKVSTEAKVDFVGLTVQEAYFDGIVNPMLLDIFFKVNCFLTFADTNEPHFDKLAFYDRLQLSWIDFENKVSVLFGMDVIDELWVYTEQWAAEFSTYQNSTAGLIDKMKTFADSVIARTDESVGLLQSFSQEDIGKLVTAAKDMGFDLSNIKSLDEQDTLEGQN